MFSFYNLLFLQEISERIVCTRRSYYDCLDVNPYTIYNCIREPDICTTVITASEQYFNWPVLWIMMMFIILASLSLIYVYYLEMFGIDDSVVGNDYMSNYIQWLMGLIQQSNFATCTIRSLFMSTPNVAIHQARNHTHPNSAAVRNSGATFMDLFGLTTGRRPYFIQQSAADIRHGRAGCRTYYWSKDLSVPFSPMQPLESDILCFSDVDMYVDMPSFLSTYFQPVLISTFQPSCVAQSSGEFSFYFNVDNEVVYNVAGGASYQHKVWNYKADVLMVRSTTYAYIHTYHIYNIDRRQLDEHHQLILLTPIKRVISPFIYLDKYIGSTPLERLRPVVRLSVKTSEGERVGVFTRMTINTSNGVFRSTGKPYTYLNAYIPAEADDTLSVLADVGKKIELTPAQVKTVVEVDQAAATVLTEYHRYKSGHLSDDVYPVELSVYNFQHNPKEYDAQASASLTPFMSPIITGCYAPDKCKNNDQAAINGRVISVKPPSEITVSQKMLMYMEEFSELLIPISHKAHPVDFETVHEKQSRPAQRAILNRALTIAASTVSDPVQSFQKSEAYGKVTDPRIISTIPGVNKVNYSRYTYAFTHVLRATIWYAFALTPIKIAQRVADICSHSTRVILTDLSRFDGRVSIVLRTLEKILMLRYFHERYHRELNELAASQKNQRAYTTFGVKYDTGESRLSGSPETADLNSVDNAFMAYVTLRETKDVDGHFFSPLQAYQKLGLYGGDDGITSDVRAEKYVEVCSMFGQVLEAEVVDRGCSGVNFLAREYSNGVWHGALDSMCDIKRQLSKLHTTVSLPASVTPFQKLAEKLYAYYLTDANTPIIGELATVLVTVFPELVPSELGTLAGVAYYHALAPGEEQYPNQNDANNWMGSSVLRQLPGFDHSLFTNWLDTVIATKDKELLLKPPLCLLVPPKNESSVSVVINGDVIPPDRKPSDKPAKREYTPEQLAKMAKTPCKAFANGTCKFAKCRFLHVPKA